MSAYSWMNYPFEKVHIGNFADDGTFVSSFGTSTPIERMEHPSDEPEEGDKFSEILDTLEKKIIGMDFLGRNDVFCSFSKISNENKKFVEDLKQMYSHKEVVDILEEVTLLENVECDPKLRGHYFVNY